MKRPLFICTFLLALCFSISGCVTKGGRKLGSGSVGRVIQPQTGEQINQSAQFNPIVSRPHQGPPAKPKASKTKPTVESEKILKKSAIAKTPPVVVKTPPVKLKNFEPTISLPPAEVEVRPTLPEEKKVNVIPINNPDSNDNGNDGETIVDDGTSVGVVDIDEEKENKMETSWTDLIIFYGILAVIVMLIWLFLDKRDTGQGLINKIKNWWNGNKAEPKKRAPAKRAKRPVKKKPLANRGERKSNLAAKKSAAKKSAAKKNASKKKK